VDLAAYEFLPEEANSTERPNRRDWSFTWERRGFKAPARPDGAPYRLRVTLQGAEVGGAEEFLKVPEAWQRDFQRLRSSNELYENIALVPYVLLNGGLLWVLFDFSRRGLIRWRGALKLGLILAALFFVMLANQWPLARANYDTNSSYTGYFVNRMVQAALGSLALGLIVSLTLAGAEPFYRRNQPDRLRLGATFSLSGIRSKEFFRSCVIGLGMAAGHIGFVVLFYLLGKNFGFWAPQDINYTDVVSTALPWVYPLTIGVYAATSEEFLFRLFAIPYLLRITGSRFLAVLIPAFVWGFLHSNYPQEPGYVRGIEVGLIGIVAGWVMLRWGILATLVWHYTVDALLISLFLLRSGSSYFRIAGALVGAGALIPLAVSGVFYLARRRFEPDEALLNRAEPLVEAAGEPAPAETEVRGVPYEPLASRTLTLALACGALSMLLLATKAETIGNFVRLAVDARQAAARADELLRQRNVNPRNWWRATTFESTFDPYANEFLRRHVGIAGANQTYREKVPSAFWRVRYFRDFQKEEYAVVIRTDGSLHSVHHLLDEKAPGASLTKEQAQSRAKVFLRDAKGLDLSKWKLVEATSDKRPARTDHAFTWEEIEPVGRPAAGQEAAHVRTEIRVQGDEVSGYRVFVKIPEEWRRRQTENTLALTIYRDALIVLVAVLGVTVLVIFFKNLKQRAAASIPWRRLVGWAVWGLLATLITFGNSLPRIFAGYPTDYPLKTFAAATVILLLLAAGFLYSVLFFLFGLAWFFLCRVFGEGRLPSWRNMPAAYYRDAFCVGLAGTAVLAGLARLPYLVERVWSPARRMLEAGLPQNLDSYYPAAQAIAGAVSGGLFVTALIALVAGFLANYMPKKWQQIGFLLLVAGGQSGGWGSPGDFRQKVLLQFITLLVVWWGITRVVRFNLLAYFLLIALTLLAGAAVQLLRQPNPFLRANGYVAVLAGVLFLAWPLANWLRAISQPPGAPGPVS
jgi:membrane protease YdiL (CAAX protease family)